MKHRWLPALSYALPLAMLFLPTWGWTQAMLSPKLWLLAVAALMSIATQPAFDPWDRSAADAGTAGPLAVFGLALPVATVLEARFLAPTTALVFDGQAVIGLIAAFAGVGLRAWSVRTLGRFFTLTVRVDVDQPVLSHGPYRYVRHPAYSGALLLFAGVPVATHSFLTFVVGTAIAYRLLMRRIDAEERALVATLGDAYDAYRKATPALLPWGDVASANSSTR